MGRQNTSVAKSSPPKAQTSTNIPPHGRPFPKTHTPPSADISQAPPTNPLTTLNPNSSPTALPIMPKLIIGAVGDKYEKEADAVASQVVQQLNSSAVVQRVFGDGSEEESEGLQMQPIVQRTSTAEAVAPELEQSIQRERGKGQTLSESLRNPLENAFGADFSGVRIHTDSTADQLNQSIQAKAFTTGQDVFFRQGAYAPKSKGGQELLAHELTHTIQQGSSPTVQRQPQSKPLISTAHQSIQNSTQFLQRKTAVVITKTRLHTFLNGKDQGKTGDKITVGQYIDISDNPSDHIKDATSGQVQWYRHATQNAYIRASTIFESIGDGTADNPDNEDDLLGGINDSILGTTEEGVSSFSEQAKEQEKNTSDLDITAGALGTASSIFGMALSIKGLISNQERGLEDWVSTIWDSLVGTGKVTSGVSGIVSSALNSESKSATDSGAVSAWAGSFASAFETLGGAVKTIKSVIDCIKMVISDDKYGRDEYLKVGSDIVSGALSTAKGVLDTIKSFIDIFSGPVGALADAIPGLDIAITAVKMIVEGYYLATSAYHWNKMRKAKDSLTQDLQSKGDKSKLSMARKEYQIKRAELTNLENRKLAKEAKNQNRQQRIDELSAKEIKLTNERQQLEQEKNQLDYDILTLEQQKETLQQQSPRDKNAVKAKEAEIKAKKGESKGKQREIEKIDDQLNGTLLSSGIKKEKSELSTKVLATANKINSAQLAIGTKTSEMANYAQTSGISQDDIQEFELADELKSVNRKRIVRQSIHLSTDAVKIAASITTMAGVSAPVGVALKASAAGVDIGLPFFRAVKQYGRKKAAKSQAKGETGTFSQWVFDANKSDVAKLAERKRHTVTIFKMVNKLNDHVPLSTDDPIVKGQKINLFKNASARVEAFIKASGCEPKALYRLNGKPNEQASLILKALYKREF